MSDEDARTSILIAGLDDWVSLAEAEGYVSDSKPDAEDDQLRRATIDVIEHMATENLLQVGELAPRFEPWATSPEEAVARLRREWVVANVKMDHGFDWWLCLTSAGKELARAIEDQASKGESDEAEDA